MSSGSTKNIYLCYVTKKEGQHLVATHLLLLYARKFIIVYPD